MRIASLLGAELSLEKVVVEMITACKKLYTSFYKK
jgi:hypothetical protein